MSQSTDIMVALALVIIVVLAVALSFGLDIAHKLGHWWTGQMEEAERRAALPRVRAPLLSINIHNRPADYVDDEESDDPHDVDVSASEKTPKMVVSGVKPGETRLPDFLPETDLWAILSALETTGTKRTDIYKALQVKPGSGREYQFVKAQLDAATEQRNVSQFPELIKDGRPVASHLRTQAKRS
jgi:hypothetical protein